MTIEQIWEYIGYLASVIVFVSFIMSSVVKLRWVNTIGALIFAVYALAIKSYPTAILNIGLVAINIYYLIKMKKREEIFSAHYCRVDNEFLKSFVMFNGRDIQKHFSNFTLGETDSNTAIFVYCNLTAAGLIMGKNNGDGTMRVDLDYATPEYRDCRVGKFLYKKLKSLGFNKLIAQTEDEGHKSYLKSMGFVQDGNNFIKEI
ncbi:MAG: YgjV family protein [Clostridia bacterium]|nr:YgjV family protein [Clostridia bacterium]